MRRPRILFLSPCWPLGQTFGGQLRAFHTADALRQIGDVTVVVVGTEADNRAAALASAHAFATQPPVPTPFAPRTGWEQLRWALDPRYLNVHGCAATAADRARIARGILEHDLVWVLNGRTPNLLHLWQWPHTHLDIDDVPSLSTRGVPSGNPAAYLARRTRQWLLRRRERRWSQRFTTLSVCSEADRRYLRLPHTHVIPNGFATPAQVPPRRPSREAPRLGFIGLYSHAPNLEGMRWFLRDVWPRIRTQVPGIRLRLIGRDTDGPLRPVEADVDALGWLADPADEIATWSAMIVPIRSGGGTRIKLAEAFSRRCPVVATPYGAYGYEVRDGVQLRLCGDAAAFAAACSHLARDPRAGAQLAAAAWTQFQAQWTWEKITPRIWHAAEDCLRRSAPQRAAVPVRA